MSKTTVYLYGALLAAGVLGAAVGCDPINGGPPGLFRGPPAIVVENVFQETLVRTMSVDLREWSECDRITWDFGDGSLAVDLPREQGQTVTHTFPASGNYLIEVHLFSATDPINRGRALLASGALPIDVIGPNVAPEAQIVTIALTDDNGDPVPRGFTFSGTGSIDEDGEIESFAWDFGDQSHTETGAMVEHTYATSGRFTVTLTVRDDRGAEDSVTAEVVANIAPTATFIADELPGTNGRGFQFNAAASSDADGQIVAFSWDFGDDTDEPTGQTVQHTFATPGNYEVTLTVTDDLDESATFTMTIDATGDEPFIGSISPTVGEVGAQVTVRISGFNFLDGTTARLFGGANPDIIATSVMFEGDESLVAEFDLAGATTGIRSLRIQDPNGLTATLDDAFTIVTPNLVRLTTTMGDIVLELDPVAAPETVANFFQYTTELRFDGTVFHRVIGPPNPFVIQGGGFEPIIAGDSTGARLRERDTLDPIRSEANNGLSNIRGTIAMALRGSDANSATSQFFINLSDDNDFLDTGPPPFTVFGQVVEGMDVVDAIAAVATGNASVINKEGNVITLQDVPVTDVIITTARRE